MIYLGDVMSMYLGHCLDFRSVERRLPKWHRQWFGMRKEQRSRAAEELFGSQSFRVSGFQGYAGLLRCGKYSCRCWSCRWCCLKMWPGGEVFTLRRPAEIGSIINRVGTDGRQVAPKICTNCRSSSSNSSNSHSSSKTGSCCVAGSWVAQGSHSLFLSLSISLSLSFNLSISVSFSRWQVIQSTLSFRLLATNFPMAYIRTSCWKLWKGHDVLIKCHCHTATVPQCLPHAKCPISEGNAPAAIQLPCCLLTNRIRIRIRIQKQGTRRMWHTDRLTCNNLRSCGKLGYFREFR